MIMTDYHVSYVFFFVSYLSFKVVVTKLCHASQRQISNFRNVDFTQCPNFGIAVVQGWTIKLCEFELSGPLVI